MRRSRRAGLIAGLREATRELRDHPLACPWLRGVSDTGAELWGTWARDTSAAAR